MRRASAKATKVKAYTRKDGTQVKESRATNPNASKTDNYTHEGNVNPYTGKPGNKD